MTDVLNFVSKGKDDASEALIRARQNVIALSNSISDLSSVSGKQAQTLSKELIGLGNIVRTLPAHNKHVEDHAKQWRAMRGELREATSAITKEVIPAMRALGVGGLIAGVALDKIIEKTQEVGEASRHLLNFSRQTGYARETIEDWTGAAKLFGSTASGMTSTLAGLAKQMQMLKTLPGGGDLYTKLFQSDRSGRGAAVARQLKATMQGQGTDAEKLSKNLGVLLDYLEQTRKVMGEPYTRTLAEQMGLADLVGALRYTKEQREQLFHDLEKLRGEPLPAADVDAYALSTVRLSAAMEGLSKAIFGALLPVMTQLNDAIADLIGANKDGIGTGITQFLKDLRTNLEAIPFVKLAAAVKTGAENPVAQSAMMAMLRAMFPGIGLMQHLPKILHSIPHGAAGGSVAETGLAVIHQGELLVPEGGFAALEQRHGQQQLEENTRELHELNEKLQRLLVDQDIGQGGLLSRTMGLGGGGVTGVGGPGGTGPGAPGSPGSPGSPGTPDVPAPPKIEPLPPGHPTAAGVPGLAGSPSGPAMTKEQREAAGRPPQAGKPEGPGTSTTSREAFAIEYFKSKGWSEQAAIGFVTSLRGETSNLKIDQPHDQGRGYGIAGWDRTRQANFARIFGHDIRQSTLEEQLEFYHRELSGEGDSGMKRAGDAAKQKGVTAGDVSRIVTQYGERPGNAAEKGRERGSPAWIADTERRYREYIKTHSASGAPTAPTPPPPTGAVGPVAGLPGGPSGPTLTPEQRKAMAGPPPTQAQPPGNALDIPKSSYTPASRGQMEGNAPQQLLLHYTGGVIKSGEQYSRMASGGDPYMTKYNAQLFMDEDGNITRITPYGQITWHAGQANAFSEGMEISTKYGGTNPNLKGSGLNEKQREALKRYYAQARGAGMYPGGVTSHSLAQPGHRTNEGEFEARMLQNMTPEQLVQYSKTTAETAAVTAPAPSAPAVTSKPTVAPDSTEDSWTWRHNIIKNDPDYKDQDLPTKPSASAKPPPVDAATRPGGRPAEPPPKPAEPPPQAAAKTPAERVAAIAETVKSGAAPSHAGGAFNVLGGLAHLHAGEMVLPRGVADMVRQGQSLAQGGIGGQIGQIQGLLRGKLGGMFPQIGQLSGMAEQAVHQLTGKAGLNIDIPNVSGAVQGGAEQLFKQVGLNRMLAMPFADQHSAPEQLGQ